MAIRRSTATTIVLVIIFFISFLVSCDAQWTFNTRGVQKYVYKKKEWKLDGENKTYQTRFELEEKRVLAFLEDGSTYIYFIEDAQYLEDEEQYKILCRDMGSDPDQYTIIFDMKGQSVFVFVHVTDNMFMHNIDGIWKTKKS
jgi:hypothetical protein